MTRIRKPRVSRRPTAERVRELLDYDADTGRLSWKTTHRLAGRDVGSSLLKDGYRRVSIDDSSWAQHRIIWLYVHGYWPTTEIDHVNCDRLDNRIDNLRLANRSQNASNARKAKNNTSGYKGVNLHKHHGRYRWRASISIDGKQKTLGHRDDPLEAYKLYCDAAFRYKGEFARVE